MAAKPSDIPWMPTPQVPVGCPPGLEYLSQIDQVLVHQQVELLEGNIIYAETSCRRGVWPSYEHMNAISLCLKELATLEMLRYIAIKCRRLEFEFNQGVRCKITKMDCR